ncbi:hypothetical protein EJC49_02960 [Aquibium carbonis]|uniref:Uncharacterized protein n=1 Tax=Aquibium carbonis TaxID=2495581 RepID=A0A3R9YAJ7_9HYPH|nr:hypothetical protein [Aquibium carbonis]RST87945.1 hypothetical protein EJC49_02960 [Aquibium carbonis]
MPANETGRRSGKTIRTMLMTALPFPLQAHALGAALARIALVLLILSAPMLALAGNGSGGGNFVGTEIQRSNGAGLVIMFGLQRAR